jgi:NitT/TauT family transport system ATP-binding protein
VTHSLREAITLADRIVFLSTSPTHVVRAADVPLSDDERRDERSIEAIRQQLVQAD